MCSCAAMAEPQICSTSLNKLQLYPPNYLAFYENGSDLWDTEINWGVIADASVDNEHYKMVWKTNMLNSTLLPVLLVINLILRF